MFRSFDVRSIQASQASSLDQDTTRSFAKWSDALLELIVGIDHCKSVDINIVDGESIMEKWPFTKGLQPGRLD